MESPSSDLQEEIGLDTVKTRAVKGVVVLTGRTFFLSILSLIATGFLTVFLDPAEFGVFWIVSAIVNFLAYFSDVGLAAALIQKKEAPSEEDLETTFTVQQILVFLLIVILIALTPIFTKVYSLTFQGKLLMYSLGASLVFSSLKTIPSVIIERRLEFGKLVLPQVLENLVYNVIAVVLAWKGFGIASFTIAVLVRGLVGLVTIYILQPWKPSFAFSKKSFRGLLTYGVPYQANTLLATLKDDGMTAVLGGILGSTGIGYLGWAQKWGQAPLRFFMDQVLKVTFPAFARMQDKREHLERSLTRSIFFVCLLVFPSLAGLLILSPVLVQIIPRYEKWTPALLPLGLVAINTVFAAVSTPLTNLLNAIGKIKTTFKLMIMWTALTWLFIPYLAYKYGVAGAALGYSLVGASSVIAIYVARLQVHFSLSYAVFKPAIATLGMSLVLIILRSLLNVSFNSVWVIVAMGVVIYSLLIFLLIGLGILKDVKRSFKMFFSK
jgi:O-antigen/teichoic acid export membrane protein